MMDEFSAYLLEKQNQPQEPEEVLPSAQDQVNANLQTANVLFGDVRQWLKTT